VGTVKLRDRVAIVTGAAQGIGQAIALGLASEGAHVVIADLQEEKARETAGQIREMGRRSLALRVDVSDLNDLSTLVKTVMGEFGAIDILVNNAGIALGTPFLETTEEAWNKIMDVNLKSAFFCSQYVARIMVKQQRGKIVNLASTSSFVAGRQEVPYAISKAGVRMLTASASAELAPHNINVNAIAPGLIKTPLTAKHFPSPEALEARVKAKTPMGRAGTPKDLVGAVVFLCSDDAEYVTGHTLVVDGGWLTQ
jgi:NAD(P)-dependent dehydrogenase (short-subunit alcohol dehydrogenase family)